MNIDETIGANVHQQMWRARVSQVQLAGALGVDQAAVSRRLRGKTPWKASEIMAAAALLGVDITDLYPRTPQTEPSTAAAAGDDTRRYLPSGFRAGTRLATIFGSAVDLNTRIYALRPQPEAA